MIKFENRKRQEANVPDVNLLNTNFMAEHKKYRKNEERIHENKRQTKIELKIDHWKKKRSETQRWKYQNLCAADNRNKNKIKQKTNYWRDKKDSIKWHHKLALNTVIASAKQAIYMRAPIKLVCFIFELNRFYFDFIPLKWNGRDND